MRRCISGLLVATSLFAGNSRVILKHRENKGVGYETGYTTGALFFTPTWKRNFYPFLDLRAHVLNDGHFASNLGLGFRMSAWSWEFGANSYFDYRDASTMGIKQLGFGLEGLSQHVDCRINGYLPITGMENLSKPSFAGFSGNLCLVKKTATMAIPKLEGEIGFPVPCVLDLVDFYAAVGPYYLFSASVNGIKSHDALGGRARVSARLCDGILFELSGTYDSVYDTRIQGMLSFSFPFGPANMRSKGKRFKALTIKNKERVARMTQSVERSEIIPVREKSRTAPYMRRFIFCDNRNGCQGTFEDPYASLVDAFAEARSNDIIIFLAGDGTTSKNESVRVDMKYGQRLIGGAENIDMGTFVIPAIAPGTRPVLSSNGQRYAIGLADMSEVRGIDIDGAKDAFYPLPGAYSFHVENSSAKNVEGWAFTQLSDLCREQEGALVAIHPPVEGARVLRNNSFDAPVNMMNQPGGRNIFEGNTISSNRAIALHFTGVDGESTIRNNTIDGAVIISGAQFNAPAVFHIKNNTITGSLSTESYAGHPIFNR